MILNPTYLSNTVKQKTLANSKLNCIWQRKLKVQPLAFSDITSKWQIKLWQICGKSPNSPKFPPPKFSAIRYQSILCMPLPNMQIHILYVASHVPHQSAQDNPKGSQRKLVVGSDKSELNRWPEPQIEMKPMLLLSSATPVLRYTDYYHARN